MNAARLSLDAINSVFQDVYAKIKPLITGNLDISGRRVINAGKAIQAGDYVTKQELDDLAAQVTAAAQPTTPQGPLNIKSPFRVGAYATIGAAAAHPQQEFVASDRTYSAYVSDGSVWTELQAIEVDDAVTNAITVAGKHVHRTSGVPAAGFGTALDTLLDSSNNTLRVASELSTIWGVATDGSETAVWAVRLRAAGVAIADYFNVLITGIKFKIGGFYAILSHANSADRTYTFADETGNIVYQTAGLTDHAIVLGSGGAAKVKAGTLGTTVTVLHGNASGDPTYAAVSLTADVSGQLPVANGGTGSATAGGARTNLGAAAAGTPTAHTITLAKITSGGTNGSITWNADGCVTAFVDPT